MNGLHLFAGHKQQRRLLQTSRVGLWPVPPRVGLEHIDALAVADLSEVRRAQNVTQKSVDRLVNLFCRFQKICCFLHHVSENLATRKVSWHVVTIDQACERCGELKGRDNRPCGVR